MGQREDMHPIVRLVASPSTHGFGSFALVVLRGPYGTRPDELARIAIIHRHEP